MKMTRYSEPQILAILRSCDRVKAVCRWLICAMSMV